MRFSGWAYLIAEEQDDEVTPTRREHDDRGPSGREGPSQPGMGTGLDCGSKVDPRRGTITRDPDVSPPG